MGTFLLLQLATRVSSVISGVGGFQFLTVVALKKLHEWDNRFGLPALHLVL